MTQNAGECVDVVKYEIPGITCEKPAGKITNSSYVTMGCYNQHKGELVPKGPNCNHATAELL